MPDIFGGDDKLTGGAAAAAPIVPAKPPWWPPINTEIPNEPGQLEGLASDMAAGGFGTQAPDLAWLRNIFRPVDSVAWNQPEGSAVVAPVAKPKAAAAKPAAKAAAKPAVLPKVSPVAPMKNPYAAYGGDIALGGSYSNPGWKPVTAPFGSRGYYFSGRNSR